MRAPPDQTGPAGASGAPPLREHPLRRLVAAVSAFAVAWWPVLLLVAVVVVAQSTGETFATALAARAAILGIAALSLAFVLGQGGLVSFGHAAPFGFGAYAALIAGEAGIHDIAAVIGLAALAGAAFAAATGAVALRTRGVYFIMITLAFAQMAYFVFASLSVYGGDDGMALARRATVFGAKLLRGDLPLAVLAIGVLALTFAGLRRLTDARFGAVLRAARDNEIRVAALGIGAGPVRLTAYAIAGAVAGIAGALLAEQTEFVAPAIMNWHRSGELIVMVVLGGAGRAGSSTLKGAIAGAIALVALEEALGHVTEYGKLGLGLAILTVVFARARAARR